MSAVPALSRRRRLNRWRLPVAIGEVSTPLIIVVLLMVPALGLEASGWPIDLRTVAPVTLFGVGIGYAISLSRFGELSSLFLGFGYGMGTVLLVSAYHVNLPFLDGIAAVVQVVWEWSLDAITGGVNPDGLVLTLLVSLLFWFLAFNAVWHAVRIDRVWRVILPPGLALVATMILYSGADDLDWHLVIYLLMSLVLIVRSNLDTRELEWSMRNIHAPRAVRRQFAAIGIALSLLGLGLAWGAPNAGLRERLDSFQDFLTSDPIQRMSEVWSRLFPPIQGDGPATTDYYGADLLNLGGAISLGDEVVFLVDAPQSGHRYYWRSRVFERYIDGQWSPSADLRITDRSAPIEVSMNTETIGYRRQAVRQHITMVTPNSRIYYAAPQPSLIENTGRIDLIYTDKPDNSSINVSVIRPLRALKRGESYSVVSLLSAASAHELRGASTDYPDWVRGPNLYIGQPNARILNLAQQIISDAGAGNPYDQAKAIEGWLRRNIVYNEAISAPPSNVDSVEWVLFEARQGYCTYYATAMIVMLRHLDIPARLAAGFSQGEYDSNINRFVVREKQAHTWVEVYFPGYGWIAFEPTSAEAPYNREGDELAQPQQEGAEAQPTTSPTPTPSPTSPPTQALQEQIDVAPSPTPTPSPPPPSPTPVIAPTVEPPILPEAPPPPVAFLEPLLTLAAALLVSLVILALILLLLFWWWEWRGLAGLSPISRAYARLERYIGLIGIHIGSDKTTLEKRRELQRRIPAAKEPIRTISDLYTRERYGAESPDPGENARFAARAERAWYRTRGNIIRRWLRRLLPFMGKD